MLVLSRRPHQSVVFPSLGVSVQVLRVAGQTVRLGVEAPRDIPVLREELDRPGPRPPGGGDAAARQARHRLRGRLNTATMALYLAQRQLRAGAAVDVDDSLRHALDELAELEREVAAAPPARRIKALLVEDNPHESALLESYLRLSGLDVDNVGDGCEALDYLATHERPDAVLLDMRLPRCDGPTTVAAIRSNPAYAGLKLFAVSGLRPAEVNVTTGPAGVDDWFSKPLNPARLVDSLTRAVLRG
jgi:carbon storage regulator CsrA